jgi:hypothetical protein
MHDFHVIVLQHTLIVADPANLIDAAMIVNKNQKAPFLFRGIG